MIDSAASAPPRHSAHALGACIVHTERALTQWRHSPSAMGTAIVMPVFMLATLTVIFGGLLDDATGTDSVYGLVPMVLSAGVLFGAIANAVAVVDERTAGLTARFATIRAPLGSVTVGRLAAAVIRNVVSSIAVLVLAVILGFRVDSAAGAALFVATFVLLVLVVETFLLACASRASSGDAITNAIAVVPLLMFLNSGFLPTADLHPAVRALVENAPLSGPVDVMRDAATGAGTDTHSLVVSVVWAGVLIVCALFLGHGRWTRTD